MLEALAAMHRMAEELEAQPVPKNRVDVQRFVDMVSIVVDCLDAPKREEFIRGMLALAELPKDRRP